MQWESNPLKVASLKIDEEKLLEQDAKTAEERVYLSEKERWSIELLEAFVVLSRTSVFGKPTEEERIEFVENFNFSYDDDFDPEINEIARLRQSKNREIHKISPPKQSNYIGR